MRRSLAAVIAVAGTLVSCTGYQEIASAREGWDSEIVSTTYRHKYGVEVSKKDWETRGRDGQIISQRKDGSTVVTTYGSGVLDGDTTYTFAHSQTIEKVDTFHRGRLVKEVWNYPSGLPREEREHLTSGATVVTVWYESGNPMCVEEWRGDSLITGRYFRRDETLDGEVVDGHGMRKQRDAYGQLISADEIVEGVLVTKTTFYPAGTPKEIIPYQKGDVHGHKRTFLPSGEPKTIEEWKWGKQHGTTIAFRNGEKYAEIPFEKGYRKGVERRFRDGERVEEEITWVLDEKHGPTRVFIGDTVKTDWYYQGKLVSKVVFEQMSHA